MFLFIFADETVQSVNKPLLLVCVIRTVSRRDTERLFENTLQRRNLMADLMVFHSFKRRLRFFC